MDLDDLKKYFNDDLVEDVKPSHGTAVLTESKVKKGEGTDKITIVGLSENSFFVKLDEHPVFSNYISKTKSGATKRCDYVIFHEGGDKTTHILLCELKSSSRSISAAVDQLVLGQLFVEYLVSILDHFDNKEKNNNFIGKIKNKNFDNKIKNKNFDKEIKKNNFDKKIKTYRLILQKSKHKFKISNLGGNKIPKDIKAITPQGRVEECVISHTVKISSILE